MECSARQGLGGVAEQEGQDEDALDLLRLAFSLAPYDAAADCLEYLNLLETLISALLRKPFTLELKRKILIKI